MHSVALQLVEPFRYVSKGVNRTLIWGTVFILLVFWWFSSGPLFPNPWLVLKSIYELWTSGGLFDDLLTSLLLNLEAIGLSLLISMALAYATVMPLFRPIVIAVGKLRFLSMVGLKLMFIVMVGGGHSLKLWMLVFGTTVFLVTSLTEIVSGLSPD